MILYQAITNPNSLANELERKKQALMNAYEWTREYVDSLSDQMVDHYYDILRYGD